MLQVQVTPNKGLGCRTSSFEVDVFFSDVGCSTRNLIDSGFLVVPSLCRTVAFSTG